MQLTTMLGIAVGLFLFTAIYMMFIYSRYDSITGDNDGKIVLLIMSVIMVLSSLCFGGALFYCL